MVDVENFEDMEGSGRRTGDNNGVGGVHEHAKV